MQVLLPGRTRQAIHSQASHLGVTVSNWSDQERQFLKDHHGIMPISKIASILGRSPEGARRMAYGMDPGKKSEEACEPLDRAGNGNTACALESGSMDSASVMVSHSWCEIFMSKFLIEKGFVDTLGHAFNRFQLVRGAGGLQRRDKLAR
ncbi:hypothetical protein [Citrobacter sp. 50677481]|uniref:hypothetical protein n=1 Tax=Citrobacter sp. 50677481 TaxID=1736699 RepID=UPI00178CD51E|nr:hypothetical protein [Citrobacter sp. 50677481]HCQ7754014.1 hypothetical protein [Citrobacter sedlakii]